MTPKEECILLCERIGFVFIILILLLLLAVQETKAQSFYRSKRKISHASKHIICKEFAHKATYLNPKR